MQLQLVPLQGAAQCVVQHQRPIRLRLYLAGEKPVVVAPFFLGFVHGRIGAARQRVQVGAILRVQRNADRRSHGEFVLFDLKRLQCRLQQLVCHAGGTCGVRVGQQDNELIATQACHCVLLAHGGFQPHGQCHQHLIAHPVSQGVIDVFKVIQVQKHQGKALLVAPGDIQGVLAAVVEQEPVGQTGERVKMRQSLNHGLGLLLLHGLSFKRHHGALELQSPALHQFLQVGTGLKQRTFGPLSGADVHRDPDGAHAWVVGVNRPGANVAINGRAILLAQSHLALKPQTFRERDLPEAGSFKPVLLGRIPLARRAALQLTGLVTEQGLEGLVTPGGHALAQKHDAHHGVIQNQTLLNQHRLKLRLSRFLLGDVVNNPDGALARVGGVHEFAGHMGPELGLVPALHPHL